MRFLTRALMAAALLGGAGGALSAGSAQAATGCGVQIPWSDWAKLPIDGGVALTCGDKEFTWKSTTTIGDLASSLVSADEPLAGDYLFNLDFVGSESSTTIPFNFTYEAKITDPHKVFSAIDIDSNADKFANPASVLTGTYTFAGGNSPITLISNNGSADLASVIGGPKTITVNNDYDGEGGTIDSFQNSFQQSSSRVPGPLPILGAGMAFGFSRKLRRRIQGQRVTT